jgi:SAM-dependent methyltransferase
VLAAAKRGALYGGRRYVDPICGRSYRRFKDGRRNRPQVYCPGCLSAERHRVLWLYLSRRLLPLRSGPLRLLHVAPERSLAGRLRSLPQVDYLSIDANPGAAMRVADLTDLPLDDGSADLVICNHVLEHIPDDRAALREIRRVLAPGGVAVKQHPIDPNRAETFEDWSVTDPEDRLRTFFQEDHVRIYGRDFRHRLEESGFAAVETEWYEDWLEPEEIERYRLRQLPSSTPERDLEGSTIYLARAD